MYEIIDLNHLHLVHGGTERINCDFKNEIECRILHGAFIILTAAGFGLTSSAVTWLGFFIELYFGACIGELLYDFHGRSIVSKCAPPRPIVDNLLCF